MSFLFFHIGLADVRGQRLKNTPASRFCQEPNLDEHPRVAQKV